MTVFVVHPLTSSSLRDNIAAAAKFGELKHVNQYYIHGDELEQTHHGVLGTDDGIDNLIPTGYRVNFERAVADFRPDIDYLLIAGDHLQLLALTALLAGYFHWFRVLRWDRKISDYIPVRLSSGIVPPRRAVLTSSGTDIGETDHGESRDQEAARIYREGGEPRSTEWTKHQFLDGPLTRKPPE